MIERAMLEYAANALWQVPLVAGAGWLVLRGARARAVVEHRVWLAVLGVCVLLPVCGVHGVVQPQVVQPAVVQPAAATSAVRMREAGTLGGEDMLLAQEMAVMPKGSEAEALPADSAQDVVPELKRAGRGAWAVPLWMKRTEVAPKLGTMAARGLAVLYGAGLCLGMVRIVRGWLVARRLVAGACASAMPEWARQEWEAYGRVAGLVLPEVRQSAAVLSPVLVGLARPRLLVPAGFWEHGREEVRAALLHELAHAERRDCVTQLVCELGSLPVVWHPAMRWIGQRIRQTREVVCDGMAAEAMGSEMVYARSLLALARRMLDAGVPLAAAQGMGLFNDGVLEERVMRLTEQKKTMRVRAKVGVAMRTAAVVVTTAGVVGMFHVRPTLAEARRDGQTHRNNLAVEQAAPAPPPMPAPAPAAVPSPSGQRPSPTPAPSPLAAPAPLAAAAPASPGAPNAAPVPPIGALAPLAPLGPMPLALPAQAPLAAPAPVQAAPPVPPVGFHADSVGSSEGSSFSFGSSGSGSGGPVAAVVDKALAGVPRTTGWTAAGIGSSATVTAGAGEYVHRWTAADGKQVVIANHEQREPTVEERTKIEHELQETIARLKSPEFKKEIRDAAQAMAAVQLNSPELKRQIVEAQKAAAAAAARVNSPEFKRQVEEAQKLAPEATTLMNSPEFKRQVKEAQKLAQEASSLVNNPEMKAQMDAARRDADAAAARVNSPEFQKEIADAARAMTDAKINSAEMKAKMDAAEREIAAAQVNPALQKKMQDAEAKMREARKEMDEAMREMRDAQGKTAVAPK